MFQLLLIEAKNFYGKVPFFGIQSSLQNKELRLIPRKDHFQNHYQHLFLYFFKIQGYFLSRFLFQNSTILHNQVHHNIPLNNLSFFLFFRVNHFSQLDYLSHQVIHYFENYLLVFLHHLSRYHKFLHINLLLRLNYLKQFISLNG